MTDLPAEIMLYLPDEEATVSLGKRLAEFLGAGDVVLLEGPIGAGKSHLARSIIQNRLGRMEDVPSPTFTLVQTYSADPDIWHADLYRISHPDEILELGIEDAFSSAICLIEWPDRLGSHRPTDALVLQLQSHGDGRKAVLSGGRTGLLEALCMPK